MVVNSQLFQNYRKTAQLESKFIIAYVIESNYSIANQTISYFHHLESEIDKALIEFQQK